MLAAGLNYLCCCCALLLLLLAPLDDQDAGHPPCVVDALIEIGMISTREASVHDMHGPSSRGTNTKQGNQEVSSTASLTECLPARRG